MSHGKSVPRNRQRWGSTNSRDHAPHPISVLKSKYMVIAETVDSVRSLIMKYSGTKRSLSINTSTLVTNLASMPNVLERWHIIKSKTPANKILQLTQLSNRCIVIILDVKRLILKLDEYSTINHEDMIDKLIMMCPLLSESIKLL